jgi:hypothetical protein
MNSIQPDQISAALQGKIVAAASSSLNRFAIAFESGDGIIIEALGTEDGARMNVALVNKESLPNLEEAVCTVDWEWIVGSAIDAVVLSSSKLLLTLNPAGPLNVSLGMWQGKPFLTFMPYKAAR